MTAITLHIPLGQDAPDLEKEFTSAKNIKDESVRNSTISGLKRISQAI